MMFGRSARAQAISDDDVARQFVPSSVFAKYLANEPYLEDQTRWRVIHVDLDGSGTASYRAIAYSNARFDYLRVVRVGPPATALVGESLGVGPCDGAPGVKAIDLDGDGRPELALTCGVGNRQTQQTLFFKWTGSGLVGLNPAHDTKRNSWSTIQEPNYVDIDGDGVVEVLEPAGEWAAGDDVAEHPYSIYRLQAGSLVKAPVGVAYYDIFVRGKGKPQLVQDEFSTTPGNYTMVVVNGNRGEFMVDSAVITLNGKAVAGPQTFSAKVKRIEIPVSLAADNSLAVELRSAPKSRIQVVFVPQTSSQAAHHVKQ